MRAVKCDGVGRIVIGAAHAMPRNFVTKKYRRIPCGKIAGESDFLLTLQNHFRTL
jgi:hypothetical protein